MGGRAVSLNFAVFRSVFERGARLGAGPVLRLWRSLLTFFSRWWQIESLYRANAKYRPDLGAALRALRQVRRTAPDRARRGPRRGVPRAVARGCPPPLRRRRRNDWLARERRGARNSASRRCAASYGPMGQRLPRRVAAAARRGGLRAVPLTLASCAGHPRCSRLVQHEDGLSDWVERLGGGLRDPPLVDGPAAHPALALRARPLAAGVGAGAPGGGGLRDRGDDARGAPYPAVALLATRGRHLVARWRCGPGPPLPFLGLAPRALHGPRHRAVGRGRRARRLHRLRYRAWWTAAAIAVGDGRSR